MTLPALAWSEPTGHVYTIQEADDGASKWRTVAVPRDVTRIHFTGQDADGAFVNSTEAPAYAETIEEARIVIDVLRAGTDHLPDWREQLEAAGFVRTYPDRPEGDLLSGLWNDVRRTGLFQITVLDGTQGGNRAGEISVSSTYESDGAQSWHNVSQVDGTPAQVFEYDKAGDDKLRVRGGLPEGIDALKAGITAALAIRAARQARGGSFANPLGGPTKAR